MTVLVMGAEEKEALKTLREYAEANPVSMDDLLDQMNGKRDSVGNMPEHTRYIPDSYKVVFSIEEQPPGPCRHLSVSCKSEIPAIEAVAMIASEIGFSVDLVRSSAKENTGVHVYVEDIEDGKKAINIIEVI